jgi:deoxyribonuclease-4
MKTKIGAHVSIAGGVANAPKNAYDISGECFQLFTRSPRGGQRKEIDLEKFFEDCQKYDFEIGKDYIVHSPYYINLASADEKIYQNSIRILKDELETASEIKCSYVITHLGSSKDQDKKVAQKRVLAGLIAIYEDYKNLSMLTLEIAAGSGNVMGIDLNEFKFYFDELKKVGIEVGFCLDTCHAFAGGYDLRTEEKVQEVFQEIDQKIGLKNLKCIHFNDSKTEFNSKKDRHEHIGKGFIGEIGMKAVIQEAQKLGINVYLETNHDKIEEDLILTKNMLKN